MVRRSKWMTVWMMVFLGVALIISGCNMATKVDDPPDNDSGEDPGEVPGEDDRINIVRNPGFEESHETIEGAARYWGTNGGWDVITSVSSDFAHSGNYSLKMSSKDPGTSLTTQSIPLVGGKTYDFVGWKRSPTANQGAIRFEFYGDEGYISATPIVRFDAETENEWELMEYEFTAPEGAIRANLLLRLHAPGTIYYDDIGVFLAE